MSRITVDHGKLAALADQLDSRLLEHDRLLSMIDSQILSLPSGWEGKDAIQFASHWQSMNSAQSPVKRMTRALQAYSDWLKFSANRYKKEQAAAIARARKISL